MEHSIILVMGVSGDFHPLADIEKMAVGIPLAGEDRRPWLAAIGAWIDQEIEAGRPAVVTCSALK